MISVQSSKDPGSTGQMQLCTCARRNDQPSFRRADWHRAAQLKKDLFGMSAICEHQGRATGRRIPSCQPWPTLLNCTLTTADACIPGKSTDGEFLCVVPNRSDSRLYTDQIMRRCLPPATACSAEPRYAEVTAVLMPTLRLRLLARPGISMRHWC